MPYLTSTEANGVIIDLYVQPKSSRTKIVGLHDGAIKLKLTSPPVEGKANAQIITFLAKILKVPKSTISLLSGQQGRRKKMAVANIDPDKVRQIIAPLLK